MSENNLFAQELELQAKSLSLQAKKLQAMADALRINDCVETSQANTVLVQAVTEKVKRKGPAGWVGMYKDTGRKKQMKSYQGAAEGKQQENTSKETSSKKPKKEKTKKPKKEKTKKPKKEKKKKTAQVYDPGRDAWKN